MRLEGQAYRTFAQNVKRPRDRLDRIENLLGFGWPDTNGCFDGVEFWMEIKAPIEPKRDSTPLFGSNHKLSQDQKNWFLAQRRADGIGFIYIETDQRRVLIDGIHADRINLATIEELEGMSVWSHRRRLCGDAEWQWLRDEIVRAKYLRMLRNAEAVS